MDTRVEQVISDYLASVESRQQRAQRGWALAKQTTWLSLLTGGYLLLYLLDLYAESFQLLGVAF
jgi:hypothetical protein